MHDCGLRLTVLMTCMETAVPAQQEREAKTEECIRKGKPNLLHAALFNTKRSWKVLGIFAN